jgi:hypothetical protein
MSFQWGVDAGLPTLGSYRDAEPIEDVLLQRGRACEHRRAGAAADAHDVACEGGEILQQRPEAVHGPALVGALAGGLGLAAVETLALATGERRAASAFSRSWSSNKTGASARRICQTM